jgi:hypothetical protein
MDGGGGNQEIWLRECVADFPSFLDQETHFSNMSSVT